MHSILHPDFIDFVDALNTARVKYFVVGGYAVVLHGYHSTTGYLDIWVDQTLENYKNLIKACVEFGIPVKAISESDFMGNTELDVFTFGRPPVAIDVLTVVKGVDFAKAYASAQKISIDNSQVLFLDLKSLIAAKMVSGRYKDKDDLEHLTDKK